MPRLVAAIACIGLIASSSAATAQTVSQRGFVEGVGWLFPQEAANDRTRVVGDLLLRDDVFYKPKPWLQMVAGVDVRANSHDQVSDRWRIDWSDRTIQRPPLSLRRASATVTHGRFTVEAGKQFIRWGKTDIVTPTDRFAPRDYMTVVDPEFIAVSAVRGAISAGDNTIEAVWTPSFTPSRTPLIDQRWTVLPPVAAGTPIADGGAVFPSGSQTGLRWSHVGRVVEYSLAYFNGFDNLPTIQAQPGPAAIELTRLYPAIHMYGADLAMPNRWFTLKAETSYVTSSSPVADEYVLYVVQLERQSGEWMFVGGYAGEVVTQTRALITFAPDRGLSRAIVARASYTIDSNRSVTFEAAVRQNGDGAYAKAEYSQARGQHWRVTLSLLGIGGEDTDFLGQYRRNSHATITARYSF